MEFRVFNFLFVFVFITISILGGASFLYFLDILKTVEPIASDANLLAINTQIENGYKAIDTAMVLFLIFTAALNFLAGFFLQDFPFFFWVELVFYIGLFPLVVVVNNILDTVLSINTVWSSYLTNYPISQIIINNMVALYLGFSVFYFVGRYAKRNISITTV